MKIARDNNGVAHIVGISGGKDSVCLALALKEMEPRPYTYVYTPTGNELPDMLLHLKSVEARLKQPIIGLTNGTLIGTIREQKMIPNFRSRWCTRLLKLVPFGRFMEQHAPVIAYVGLRADEDDREGTRPGGDSAPIGTQAIQDFPFQRWGWGLAEILSFLYERGIIIPDRTDCAWCFWQKLGEWYNLWLYHPEIYREGESIEAEFGHTFRSPGRDTWPVALADLRARFEAGDIPERSLNMMAKRQGMCRTCTL